jgi:hypothetical protein
MNTIQTRHNLFETNSSSTHSITIIESKLGDVLETLYPNKDNKIVIGGYDFGLSVHEYYGAEAKASYCAIYIRDWIQKKEKDKNRYLSVLIKTIQDQVGAPLEVVLPSENTGYIDHQSVENRDIDYLFEVPELLREFIFNPKSVLVTKGD